MKSEFFSRIDEPGIVEAIRRAELRSRGEIRVHVTEKKVDDVVAEAAKVFERLGMTATAERNGILVFVAPESQKFAVLGDSAIIDRGGSVALDEIARAMAEAFREGRFTDGLIGAVSRAGDLLGGWFPRGAGAPDQDELPNSISRG